MIVLVTRCNIKPRSAEHETMIRKEWAKAEQELDHEGHYNDGFFSRFDSLGVNDLDNE